MSKTIETFLLGLIISAAEENVKRLAEALEEGVDFEELTRRVHQISRVCFAPVLAAMVESRRGEVERGSKCPDCGAEMRNKGVQRRRMLTPLGAVSWQRRYYYCESCRRGHYPLDERWRVGGGQFIEAYQAGMALLGVSLSYGLAAGVFERLTGVSVSGREVARTTVERGACLEAERQGEQQVWLEEGPSPVGEALSTAYECSLDAAKVRFRDGWHEVKAGVVCPLTGAQQQSYVAEVDSMEQAGHRLYAEVVRRGADPGRNLMVCVADGASCNWAQFEAHFTERVEILDWYHAMQHLWAAANGVYGQDTPEAQAWQKQAEAALWAGRPQEVLALLDQAAQQPQGHAAAEERHYFETNQKRMGYQAYRQAGYPIGSGIMESGCKQLIIARARQAGMSWSPQGLQPVLTLRAELLSSRWDQAWSLTRPRAA